MATRIIAMSDPLPFRPPAPGSQPPLDAPEYRTTAKRHPLRPAFRMPPTITEDAGPRFSPALFPPSVDLTTNTTGQPSIGERIVIAGTITDEDGRPVPNTMIEVWQANATGRYDHPGDRHDAPLDPNFHGVGRVFTDEQGRYSLLTIRPGAYPWPNHYNGWRPTHVHFSYFGPSFATRLITQMYFPGDPLQAIDPIFNAIPDKAARERLIARFDLDLTRPDYALGYRFDVVLRGRVAKPMEG
jgi:protocatechuate 3,4-dioxygenase beta subunit